MGSITGKRRTVAVAVVAVLLGMAVGPAVGGAASIAWVRIKNFPTTMKVKVLNWPVASVASGTASSVEVANWPQTQNVAVTNTPTVAVSNLPATQNVVVTNLPATQNVAVTSVPATQNVAVTNGVSNPVKVRDVDGRTPVHKGMLIGIPANAKHSLIVDIYKVPAGKRLTVTSATMCGTMQTPISYVQLWWNGNYSYIPFTTHSDSGYLVCTGSSEGELLFEPGTTLSAYASRLSAPNEIVYVIVRVSGYLTDAP